MPSPLRHQGHLGLGVVDADGSAGRWVVDRILFCFFLTPDVEIEKQGPRQEADSIRKFVKGNVTPAPARGEASSTRRAGGVDPQSPTPGFLSDHRCTYLESMYSRTL